MKRIFYLAFLLLLLAHGGFAQVQNQIADQTVINKTFGSRIVIGFTFWVADKARINEDLTGIISIDNVKPAPDGGFIVRAYANKTEFANFLSRNIPWEPLAESAVPKAYTMATTTAQMASWDRYPVYSVYEQMMANFASTYPSLCNLDTILAATPDGHKILVLKISDNVNATENEPRFLYTSSIHGDETTGFILTLRLANYLLSNYGVISRVTDMVNNLEIWICPLANPDGTYNGGDNTIGSDPVAIRYNSNGVDLNRNYPDPRTGANPDGNSYQPETQAFMNFAALHHFTMAANFHGGAEVMNYPWDTWTTSGNPNAMASWWERVCTAYVDTSRLVDGTYMTDTYSDGVTEGGDWYVITGGRQDFMNYYQYCREVTMEIDGEKTTQTQNLNAAWNRNWRGLLNLLQESRYGIHGVITDSCTGQPIHAKVFVNSYDQANDSSHVYSWLPVGDYHKNIIAGTYSVTFSAPGYISKTITNVVTTNVSSTALNVSLAPALPVANFTADVVSTCSGLVNFTDLTTGGVTSWNWNFGDGFGSTAQNPSHQYTANGTYTVTLSASNCKGNNVMTKTSYITVNLAAVPGVTNGSRCGAGTVNLSATGTGTINWYDTPGGNLLSTGSSFTTPSISNTTTYYAAQDFSSASYVGKTDSVGGGAMYSGTTYYLKFTCTTACTLNSVKVYAGSAGDRTIALKNSSGTTLQSTTVTLPAGESRVQLNFSIPVGTDLRLAATGTTTDMYRSSGGITYPYTLAGKISITGTNASTTRYYYFYDWEIDKTVCSSTAVPVVATINPLAVASFSQSQNAAMVTFTNTSQNATSYAWDFGDGQTSTQSDPVHTYTANGTYNIRLISTNSCGNDTAYNTVTIVTVGGLAENGVAQQVNIYPNPARNMIHLAYNAQNSQDCRYEIINMVGEVSLKGEVNFHPGLVDISIDVNTLKQGVYFIKLMMNDGSVIRKIIIE